MFKTLIMLSSHEGSPDGRRVQWYLAGQTYEVTESLAAIFLKEGWAEETEHHGATCPSCGRELPQAEMPKAEASAAPGHKAEYSRKNRR